MNTPATTFGSPSGGAEYHHQTMPQRMCEKLWTLPIRISSPVRDSTGQGTYLSEHKLEL